MTVTKNTLIAQRYADALVKIAKDGKLTFEKIGSDLKSVNSTLVESSDLNSFLVNPLVSAEDKKEVLDRVFKGEIDALIMNFLKVLIDKNRFDIFGDIIDSYGEYIDDINNISRIKVTSAVEINEDLQGRLKAKLEEKTKKNVVLDLSINPDIIAGLVITMGDDVIDMSLKHKLDDLSKNIVR